MTEILNSNPTYPSVRETIQKFNMYGKVNGSLSTPIKLNGNTHSLPSISSTTSENNLNTNQIEQHISTTTISSLSPNTYEKRPSTSSKFRISDENIESITVPTSALRIVNHKGLQVPTNNSRSNSIHNNFDDDIGLEIIEFTKTQKQAINNDETHESTHCAPSTIDDYGESDIEEQPRNLYPQNSPRLPPPLPPVFGLPNLQEELNSPRKRTLPLSNFLLEIGALVVIFFLCMVLVLAIREEQANLRMIMQTGYTYIYLVSIIWMIWCTFDILKFRRQWTKLTSDAHDQADYMDIVEHYPHNIPYFPDMHNNGGLFMRAGAGLLCMGSLVLTIIELAKTIEIMRTYIEPRAVNTIHYSQSVFIMKSITFIFRFLFHCVQFLFLFRYGNLIIDRYQFIAKFGLIHIIIANFCTWFEAIVIETLEELHKHSASTTTTTHVPITFKTTKIVTLESVEMTSIAGISSTMINLFKAAPIEEPSSQNSSKTILEFIEDMQLTVGVYLYPCLIEYSLICVTVYYIMWRNVGKTENRSFLHFAARHMYNINCARVSCGLLLGGIIFLLTILSLLPAYILELRLAIIITHITELVLLIVSLLIVLISFINTTKLYYDREAHVDIFDQILIFVTTIGNFAYSFFDTFASIYIEPYTLEIPRFIEICIGLLAIFQTFLQSAFILDALKRRSITKRELRNKPGRELITALLLINLAIWLHDSLSAKKVNLNPLQSEYYDPGTWSIVQAFTSPLSIFYRFHSSVCLADIWREVYDDHGNDGIHNLIKTNNIPNNHQHA